MINHISIEGFKSLKKVDLELGNLNIFIGANASGKSNFFDALRVLQGIGYGFTIDEIFNGKPKSATSEVWEGIRGGSAKATFVDKNNRNLDDAKSIHLVVKFPESDDEPPIEYSITLTLSTGYSYVQAEKMLVGAEEMFSIVEENKDPSRPGPSIYKKTGEANTLRNGISPYLPILHQLVKNNQLSRANLKAIESCIHGLSNAQNFDPVPTVLRKYASARHVTRMGEDGENFAALVNLISSKRKDKTAYLSWLKELTPVEFDDVKILKGALNEPLFAVIENEIEYPAPVLSDGTLRFAAIAAAFFQPDMPDRLMIEEIDNGIHPSRLRLLVEMLKSQAKSGVQIMATTHSPTLLSWLDEEDYKTTFLCRRNEETGASEIIPLSEIPRFIELARKQPVGDLLTEGWLEAAL